MDNSSTPTTPPFVWPTHREICCTVEQAAAWLDCLTEMALHGDDDAAHALPTAAQHYLAALRQAAVPR